MKKNFLLVVFSLLVAGTVTAQKVTGMALFLKSGYRSAPNSAKTLNQVSKAGVTGFSNQFFLFGAESYYRTANKIISLESSASIQKRYSNANDYAEPYIGGAQARFGWIIKESNHSWIYPTVGAGVSMLSISTYQKLNHALVNRKNYTLAAPSIDFGLNSDFLFSKVNWRKTFYLGYMAGVRIGYKASISSSKWKGEKQEKPANMPPYANNGFYVALCIGGGSFDKK